MLSEKIFKCMLTKTKKKENYRRKGRKEEKEKRSNNSKEYQYSRAKDLDRTRICSAARTYMWTCKGSMDVTSTYTLKSNLNPSIRKGSARYSCTNNGAWYDALGKS